MSDIKTGDRVRSYDFPNRKDCYVEGHVEGYHAAWDCTRYRIKVDYVVWNGTPEPAPKDHVVMPPVNGTRTNRGRTTNFVEKL